MMNAHTPSAHRRLSAQPESGATHARLPFAARPLLSSDDLDEAQAQLNNHIEERRLQPCGRGDTHIRFTLQALPQLKLFGAGFGRKVHVSSSCAHWAP
ncbi:hypothetical protein [Pseudomonas sp. UBA2684]|uniref:hypothetical protein n=2 Tax=Pseudomonas TaxID=286 RepID=UPI000E8B335E|nr:hypothetical protein [Pseudomonas sp. UBA2684]HBX55327.1 hypothetical protein [Pseudomonas sp.]|tara:strand:- start:151 stop:444 length:294 start_codon:yes stop_codon:yes gene_type:complete